MAVYGYIGYGDILGGEWSTAVAASYDSAYSDRAILTDGSDRVFLRPTVAGNEKWFHFVMYDVSNAFTGSNPYETHIIRDTSNNVLFRLLNDDNSEQYDIEYLDGGSLQSGIQFTLNDSRRYTIDFHIKTGNGDGFVKIYVNEALLIEYTNLNNGTNNVGVCDFGSSTAEAFLSNRIVYYSELLVGEDGDSPTLGRRVSSFFPTGVSATYSDWDGDETNVNSESFISDGSYLNVSSAGQRHGFTFPPITATGVKIEAVQINSRAMDTATTTFDYGHSIRLGGTDYDQAALGVTPIITRYADTLYTDPSTAAPWTLANANAAEYSVVSI